MKKVGQKNKQLSPHLVVETIGKKMVLLDPEQSKLHTLNPTAQFILACVQQGRTPEEISRLLSTEYEVSLDTACVDVKDTIVQLQQQHILSS
jgi:hypothetical protein